MSTDTFTDDPASTFWTSLHDDNTTPERESHMDSAKEDAQASFNEARGRVDEADDWTASRAVREDLLSKYPDAKTGDLLGAFAQWHNDFQRDPATAADHFARSYASIGPRVSKPREQHNDTPPAYLDEKGKRNWHVDNDARLALREAQANATDRLEYEATAKERALIKQAFPDKTFSEVMIQLAAIDEAMYSAPHLVAQKVAMMYGAPATQGQVIEQHQAAQAAQHQAALSQWVSQVEASGSLPGIEHPKVQAATVQVLEHMNQTGQRTGSVENDLIVAYQHAVAGLQGELQAEQDKAAVAKARRASRSISGSSSTDVAEDQKPGSGSARDAARAAYHSHAV